MNQTNYCLAPPIQGSKNLNELLSPIFQTVKTKKINSFFQLKNHQSEELSQSIFTPKNQQPPQTARQTSRMNKTFQIRNQSLTREGPEKGEFKRKAQTSNIRHRKFKSDHPSLQGKSKIKKHLVDTIDFQEIQNKLYKRRDWMTKYEDFCNKLQHKKIEEPKKSISPALEIHKKKKLSLTPNDVIKPYATINIRSTPKKKFWVREKNNKFNPEEKGCIQGTSFKNISNF